MGWWNKVTSTPPVSIGTEELEARLENTSADLKALQLHALRQSKAIDLLIIEIADRLTGLELATLNKKLLKFWEGSTNETN